MFNEEKVFPEIIEELTHDMLSEIKMMTEKYEELKQKEIDKIKAKYKLE